jgi:outer membrane protein assembly factor BamB
MLHLLRPMLLALALFVTPSLAPAIAQEVTPVPACPGGAVPAVGAMRITDGTAAWSVCSPVEAYRSVIGASDDVVLVDERGPLDRTGVSEGHTVAYAASDGSGRWRWPTAHAPLPAGPVDGQGIVILATNDAPSALIGVDAITGQELWSIATSEVPIAQGETVAVLRGAARPDGSSGVRGIDRATGEEVWVSDIGMMDMSGVMVARSSAVVLGDVVVLPEGITITAIDMRTGARLWQAPRLDHVAGAGGVFVGIRGGQGPGTEVAVAAVDAASGDDLWHVPGRPSYGGLLAAGDDVVVVLDPVGTDWVAYELASGGERWRAATPTFVEPQVISGTSVVGMWEGELAIISTADGTTMWSATEPFGSPLMNSAGSNGDVVVIAMNSLPWRD